VPASLELVELIEEFCAIQGVRGVFIATGDGVLEGVDKSALPSSVTQDIAKTVRRMTVASATVGVPLQELLINFGASRMMVTPLSDESTVVFLLERDQAVSPVRSMLAVSREQLAQLLDGGGGAAGDAATAGTDDEIDRIMQGDLGEVLAKIYGQFETYVLRTGRSEDDAAVMMRDQMREWLLCCNPSPYTFPLLIDGLGQLLNDAPTERSQFMEEVQATIRSAQTAESAG
jgi:hypothetical protein